MALLKHKGKFNYDFRCKKFNNLVNKDDPPIMTANYVVSKTASIFNLQHRMYIFFC